MLLIDGYNLLFAANLEGDLEARRRGLVEALEKFGERARVIFDHTQGPPVYGAAPKKKGRPVEVWFVEKGITADESIIDTLRATKDRTAFTVVSSDRAVADAALRLKFRVTGSKEFWDAVQTKLASRPAPGPKETGLPPGEVDSWMREFGLEDDDSR